MGELREVLETLNWSFAVESHMEASVIIVPEPAVEGFFQILSSLIAL